MSLQQYHRRAATLYKGGPSQQKNTTILRQEHIVVQYSSKMLEMVVRGAIPRPTINPT